MLLSVSRRESPILSSWQLRGTLRLLQFQWAAHQSANQRFADVVLRNYSAGDVVWVQDYHLMLLPAMLKNRAPKMKVAHVTLSALAQDSKLPATGSYTYKNEVTTESRQGKLQDAC